MSKPPHSSNFQVRKIMKSRFFIHTLTDLAKLMLLVRIYAIKGVLTIVDANVQMK